MEGVGLPDIQAFPFTVLKRITNEFSEERIIGRGGSGIVYKGVLDNGVEIAVKKLYNHYDSSGKKLGNGEAQFLNELMNLFGVQHPNIIRLVGYCCETQSIVTECDGKRVLASEEERILCLEYMQGGSLNDHLSDESCGLEWEARFNIIKGICEGLKYLHTGSEKPIYHLDLKPDNIWLDGNMIPKIGDFGISRLPVGSMQTYATQNAVSGTIGYMAPEYVNCNQISQKCDIYSLGFIMIRVIGGQKGHENYDTNRPSEEFIERVHNNWGKRQKETMSSHSLQQVKTCTEIALTCVEYKRENRPTITDIVDKLNKIDATESSAIGGQSTEEKEHTNLEKLPDIKEQTEKNKGHLEENTKEQVDGRSAISSPHPRRSVYDEQHTHGHVLDLGSHEQDIQGHLLHLQSDVQRLKDTMPGMYNLIDEAEWRNHETCVAELLPKLKDAVYEADDLLDEFRWYEMKAILEGDESKSPFIYFFDTVIQGSFNKLNDVQRRMEHLSSQLVRLVPRKELRRFDKNIRPDTSSSCQYEGTIFGRDNELKQVMGFLNVAKYSKRKRAESSVNVSRSITPSNRVSTESRAQSLPVLPIVGIGGVGKTTLAQLICSHEEVKSHFDNIIWICVSDDFNDKRLIKEVLSYSGKKAIPDNLDALQRALSSHVNNKRFLIILDDMWDDALKEHGRCWKRVYSHLGSAEKGSMILITTRCEKVAKGVGTMEPFELKGLRDDVFWNFFKLCVFGPGSTNNNPELEHIGKKIIPKLKGSPLAARTLGHILSMDFQVSHWNTISESELWELKQEATDILPALRLSYMYLPIYLKRCFSFCAVYPKDYIFQMEYLTEIWMAEGFMESEDIGFQYFQDLLARSFFQRAPGGYVIHDLLHDMAQKVSEHDCFIIRNKNDFDKVPQNVRHIYIHSSEGILISHLLTLSKFTKLRTILCEKRLLNNTTNSVMKKWCTDLLHMRVLSCASVMMLPDSIGNLKHLRYLEISEDCPLSIPSAFCWLYHLQILYVKKCKMESLPNDFSNLKSLRTFISQGFTYNQGCTIYIRADSHQNIRLMKNLNQFRGDIDIYGIEKISKDQAAEYELKNKKYLHKLRLLWNYPKHHNPMQQNEIEVLQLLQPPVSLMSLHFERYPHVCLPNWFHPQNLPCLTSFRFSCCDWLDSISLPLISQKINLNEMHQVLVDSNNDGIGIFLSLTELTISECKELSSLKHFLRPDYLPALKSLHILKCKSLASVQTEISGRFSYLEYLYIAECENISSLEHFVHPDYIPSIKIIILDCCPSLVSVPIEKFKTFNCLERLRISHCPSLNLQRGLELPSTLCTLKLNNCGDFSAHFPGCLENLSSLVSLDIAGCQELTSVDGNIFRNKLALLDYLDIRDCPNLVSIGGVMAVAKIRKVRISSCPKLEEADKIMRRV